MPARFAPSTTRLDGASRGYTELVSEPALDAIRVTADRVRRFAEDVEREPSDDQRVRRLRGALLDLDDVMHIARTQGCDVEEIHVAARGRTGRFTRSKDTEPRVA
jgi:hypothetical protein